MNLLFKAKQRTPADLAHGLSDAIARLGVSRKQKGSTQLGDVPAESRRRGAEECARLLRHAKLVLYGDNGALCDACLLTLDRDPVPEDVAQFAQEAYTLDLLQDMLVVLPRLEFEVRTARRRMLTHSSAKTLYRFSPCYYSAASECGTRRSST